MDRLELPITKLVVDVQYIFEVVRGLEEEALVPFSSCS